MLGTKYCVEDAAALAPTQVAASRNVSIAAGSAFGRGVKTTLSAPEAVTIATPVAGQWYLIVLRRTWATKVTALVALPSTTTTATLPDITAISVPTTATGLTNTPGTVDDQPICWVWVRNTDTTQLIVDARKIHGQVTRPRVASVAARSAVTSGVYPAAIQGDEVLRNDTGCVERYHTAYNASTNPGGTIVAGWYPVDGLLPALDVADTASQTVSTLAVLTTWGTTEYQRVLPSLSSGVFTVPAGLGGRYRIDAFAKTAAGSGVGTYVEIRKGSTAIASSSDGASVSNGGFESVSADVVLAAGDTISVAAYRTASGGVTNRRLSIRYVGPA